MKIAAIYNVWDGCELLKGSMACLAKHVDWFIIVWQKVSNFGEEYNPSKEILDALPEGCHVRMIEYTPTIWEGGSNEIAKRNIGLETAKSLECTHFLHVDVDEYYWDFGEAKEEFLYAKRAGSVCHIYTYFKKPTWRLENLDGYFVPFIHELHHDTQAGRSSYPFYCDPTRVINQSDVFVMSQPMHHFSWVRDDIERKARNSSAGAFGNKLKGLLADYHSEELEAHPDGFVINDMGGQKIKIVPDLFGLSK